MNKSTDYLHILNLGLNDKDTGAQEIDTIEAAKIARNIILKHTDGATISHAEGIYTHKDGRIVVEQGLEIKLATATLKQTMAIIEGLKQAFNQESVVLRTQRVKSQFI